MPCIDDSTSCNCRPKTEVEMLEDGGDKGRSTVEVLPETHNSADDDDDDDADKLEIDLSACSATPAADDQSKTAETPPIPSVDNAKRLSTDGGCVKRRVKSMCCDSAGHFKHGAMTTAAGVSRGRRTLRKKLLKSVLKRRVMLTTGSSMTLSSESGAAMMTSPARIRPSSNNGVILNTAAGTEEGSIDADGECSVSSASSFVEDYRNCQDHYSYRLDNEVPSIF